MNLDYLRETNIFVAWMLEAIRADEDYELHWQMFGEFLAKASKSVLRALAEKEVQS